MQRSTEGCSLELENATSQVTAGGKLRGHVNLSPAWGGPGASVILQACWQTEGKGDTDKGELAAVALRTAGTPGPLRLAFELDMPMFPWSYQGKILKIVWKLRARLQLDAAVADLEREFFLVSGVVRAPSPHYR